MNWLFWVLLIFLAFSAIRGARRGFVRSAVSMVSMILLIWLSSWVNPYVGDFLRTSTPVYPVVQKECRNLVEVKVEAFLEGEEQEGVELPRTQQIQVIEGIALPQFVKDILLENNNPEIYKMLGVERFVDYLSAYLARWITNGIGFFVSFVFANLLLQLILHIADRVAGLPVLSFFNAAGGLALGAGKAMIWIWLLFAAVGLFESTEIGKLLMEQIRDNVVLETLYEQNLLMKIVMSVLFG